MGQRIARRHGRHGNRTPRSKVREAAVSPEKRDPKRYTPNGTNVPDGPPPETRDPLPPAPPFPVTPTESQDGDGMNGSLSVNSTTHVSPSLV